MADNVGAEGMQGARLEFVVQKLSGTVTRTKYAPPPPLYDDEGKRVRRPKGDLGNAKIEVVEEAGYLVMLPTGYSYRMTGEQLVRRGYDRQPAILGFEQANDPKTAAGRFKLARSEMEREKAWKQMEQQIIKRCVGRFGTIAALVDGWDPKGKLSEKEAA